MTPLPPTGAQLLADFSLVTRTGWIRYPGEHVAGPLREWSRHMDKRAMSGELCTFDGHGGHQITEAGRALAAKGTK